MVGVILIRKREKDEQLFKFLEKVEFSIKDIDKVLDKLDDVDCSPANERMLLDYARDSIKDLRIEIEKFIIDDICGEKKS